MSKENIRIKRLRLTSSLAQRAVIISLCLLVIPLFIHSVFLYRREYKDAFSDVGENVSLTAKAQKAIFEEMVSAQWQILDEAALNLAVLKNFDVFEMEMPLTGSISNHFTSISNDKNFFLAGKKVSDTKVLAIKTPVKSVFDKLTHFEKAAYPFSLAFVDSKGNVILGSKQPSILAITLPIDNGNFYLHVSIQEKKIQSLHRIWYFYHFLSLLFFVGVVGGFLLILLTQRIAKPFHQLFKAMERVGEGAVHVRYIPDKMGFEINDLGKKFNQTLDQIIIHSEEAQRQRIGRERLAQELKIGHDIQENLLPKCFPELKKFNVSTGFLPANEVGGDFYDLFLIHKNKLLIVMADVSGKGISACLYSLGLRSMLRGLASTEKIELSEIVVNANDLFWRDGKEIGMFVTLWIGIYDSSTKKLEYCSQGHPPAYLIRKHQISSLSTPGIALGAQLLDCVTTSTHILQEEDLLFLYTDGIIETHDANNRLFGSEKLKLFLSRSANFSPDQLIKSLLNEMDAFRNEKAQHDDITLLAIKFPSHS